MHRDKLFTLNQTIECVPPVTEGVAFNSHCLLSVTPNPEPLSQEMYPLETANAVQSFREVRG